ncbi:MAG: class I SAM-dependent methyltransferase [Methanobrevibacter sp.]|uniref:class I SAM-dependent methyltransferase n=1 Tax=Methanobrevibacter sp. TaxID=66852 RepID=UPI003F06BD8B
MEHRHHGKSSAKFLDSDEILNELNLKGNEVFMDVGCGDGYISKKALQDYLPDGFVYAVDNYDGAIKEMESYKKDNSIENLINIEADISKGVSSVEDNSIDVLLMLNVFHGFTEDSHRDAVIKEFSRLIKNEGKIAIMDFRPIELPFGPSLEIKCSPEELEELFNNHGFKKSYLNEEMGPESGEGNTHYIIIFEKE